MKDSTRPPQPCLLQSLYSFFICPSPPTHLTPASVVLTHKLTWDIHGREALCKQLGVLRPLKNPFSMAVNARLQLNPSNICCCPTVFKRQNLGDSLPNTRGTGKSYIVWLRSPVPVKRLGGTHMRATGHGWRVDRVGGLVAKYALSYSAQGRKGGGDILPNWGRKVIVAQNSIGRCWPPLTD